RGASLAPASPITCTSTSCRAGTATRTSCRCSTTSASSPRRSRRPTTGSGVASFADLGGALTPMMRQYRELKRRYPDYLLLFRLGDFYETFFEDAEVAARLLQITLTSRQGAPMAGIPHHAADGYIALLRRPAEILMPARTREDRALLARLEASGATLTVWEPDAGGPRRAAADLCAHFQVDALDRFGVGDMTAGVEAAALALAYLRATQGAALGHLRHLTRLTAVD